MQVSYRKASASPRRKPRLPVTWHVTLFPRTQVRNQRLSSCCVSCRVVRLRLVQFGKGVYFADMSSKSANYCYPNREKTTGLMLLSEVALGNMYELTQAEYMDKAPQVRPPPPPIIALPRRPAIDVCRAVVRVRVRRGSTARRAAARRLRTHGSR
jgi:hypothetical protein